MSAIPDVVVLGAGIVGTACALELAQAGARVTIVERDAVGGGATAAAMGHVVAMDDSPAQLTLCRYSQILWEELAPSLPSTVEYNRCGTIWVAADEEEMAEVYRRQAVYAERGIGVELLDPEALAAAEPHLRPSLAGGLHVTEDAVLYPPAAAGYLFEEAVRLGAQLIHGEAICAGSGRVRLRDGTVLSGGILINAGGAFSPALSPGVAIRKRKGHLLITDRYPGYLRHQIIELAYLRSAHATASDSVAFNVQPRANGQIVVGSSRQYGAEHSGVDDEIVHAMVERASLYMPGLANLSTLRVWSGFRAATEDKLPLIGPTADPTVYLATGHEGLGITTSLATARLLADHVLHRVPAIPPEPYFPDRTARSLAS